MKKWMLALILVFGVLALSACSSNSGSSANVAQTSAGNITQNDLYNAMKDKIGVQALQQLLFEKVLSKKYNVTDKELDARVNQLKSDLGSNFQTALAQYGYKDENDLKKTLKVGMMEEKAAMATMTVSNKEITDYYNNYKPEIRVSHILVADEATAKMIQQKLEKGANFAALAKQYSKDTASAQNGGDVGWFGTGKMDPSFEKAAYALKLNQISGPVKSQFGWHIIKKTGEKQKPSLASMKSQIINNIKQSKLTNDLINQTMAKLIKDSNVKIDDKSLQDAANPLTAAPSQSQTGQ